MKHLVPVLVVAAGGGVGSALRYLLSVFAQRQAIVFPHGTLWANLLGCLAIGAIASVAARSEVLSPTLRLLLATGLCGGFTTMSSFVYELMQFVREGDYLLAAGYFGLTFLGCVLMFWLGSFAVRIALRG